MKVLNGNEPITIGGEKTKFTIQDFWAWNSSDLLNNTLRGAYAEFIVATALGIDIKESRIDWEAYDLNYIDSAGVIKHIEVKCGAYVQSWSDENKLKEGKFSKIRFSIAPAKEWSLENGYSGDSIRRSHLYVFCLLESKEKDNKKALDMAQWTFYVVETSEINAKCGNQRNIGLNALLGLEHTKCSYDELKTVIDRISIKNNQA